MKGRVNFTAINAAALRALPVILPRWLPDGKRGGREFMAKNPTRADRTAGFFSINLVTGKWSDFATDILLHKMVRDGQIGKAGHGKYVNSGKIGKKDPAAEQAPDEANKISAFANLSDLCGKEDPGGASDERTTP